MPDNPEEDVFLFEAMSSLAPTAFRPVVPRRQCECSKQIEALTERIEEVKVPPGDMLVNTHQFLAGIVLFGAVVFASGVAAGITFILWRRKK